MNEIARQRISERVIESLDKELLSKNMAGPMLGIHPSYLSCVCNPEKLNKCPDAAWEVLQKWVNSGLSIIKYAEKNGVLVEKKPEKVITPEKKNSKENNAVLVGIINDPKDQELEPRIKVKPEPLEKLSVNLAEIGWILGLHKNGKSIEQISKELKIYIEIVKKIIPDNSSEVNVSKNQEFKPDSKNPEEQKEKLTLIDLLKARRTILIEETNAIDNLLRHYTRLMPWK